MSRNTPIYMLAVVMTCLQLFLSAVASDTPDAEGGDKEVADGAASFRIVPRNDWDKDNKVSNFKGDRFSHPVQYVVISTDCRKCSDTLECGNSILQNDSMTSNFYIGEDGLAYEGRGWDLVPGENMGGLDEFALSIVIFGNFTDSPPSENVTEALHDLINEGLKSNKVSKEYQMIGHDLIVDDESTNAVKLYESLPEDKILKGDVDINLHPDVEYPTAGLFPIVLREEWKASPKASSKEDRVGKINALVIKEYGSRCFLDEECSKNLRQYEIDDKADCGGIESNFYVADTGLAYEGRGWYENPCDGLKDANGTITVSFLGPYESYGPSPRSILALNRLIKFGQWLRKIEINYSIKTIDSFSGFESKRIGKKLSEALEKLDNFSNVPLTAN